MIRARPEPQSEAEHDYLADILWRGERKLTLREARLGRLKDEQSRKLHHEAFEAWVKASGVSE